MKQTLEEEAKAFAEECRIVNIKAGLDYPYDEIDMRNAFEAGADWQKERAIEALSSKMVEEAAMNFANYESNILDKLPFKVKNVVDYDNGLTRGFKAGADWQSKQSPWISVEDAIPNKQAKGMCRVKYVDGSIDEMAMREVNKWISPYIKTGYVTYWRPIPSFDGTLKQTKMYYNE